MSVSKRPIVLFLCVAISMTLLASSALAQAPFQETLRALPGGEKPPNLYTVLNYIQLIPYSLWMLRNPTLWGYVLSVIPTFLSEIPSFISYLRFYALQLPGAISYLLSFTTRNLDMWIDTCYSSLCRAVSSPFSSSLKIFVEWPLGFVLPNIPYIAYSLLKSVPFLIDSVEDLTSSLPQSLVSYASPTVGALSSIAPQFIPVFLSFLSSGVDWLNISIELMPEYIVRAVFDSIMLFPRCVYDLLFSCVRCLTFTYPSLFAACLDLFTNSVRLLPYIPEAFSYIAPFFETLSSAIDALPDLLLAINLVFVSAVSAFVASLPAFFVNLTSALLMSLPLALKAFFEVLCGGSALLCLKLPSALLCGVPAHALSVCSSFLFMTLPREVHHLMRSAISLSIDLLGIIMSRFFALPCVVCYRCFSLPYSAVGFCVDSCESLIEPVTKYLASRMAEVIS